MALWDAVNVGAFHFWGRNGFTSLGVSYCTTFVGLFEARPSTPAMAESLLDKCGSDRNRHKDGYDPGDGGLETASRELGAKHSGVEGSQEEGDIAQDVDHPPSPADEPA